MTPGEGKPPSLREALESALVEDPGDVAALSAYADLLMEQGDPRGEFIRVQLALEDEGRPAEERTQLRRREQELLAAHEGDWLGGLAPYLVGPATQRREAELADLVPRLAQYYREHPDWPAPEAISHTWARGFLHRLEFQGLTINQARRLVALPAARFLRELVVAGYQTSAQCRFDPGPDLPARQPFSPLHLLEGAPWLGKLRAFQLGEAADPEDDEPRHGFNDRPILPLVRPMHSLEELRLFGYGADLAEVLALPTLTRLRVLVLYHLFHYPLEVLADNPAFGRLTHLLCFPHGYFDEEDEDLTGRARGAFLTLEEVRAVARSPHLGALTHLRLRSCNMGDAGVEEMISSGLLKRLKSLDLRFGVITDAGATQLTACPDLRGLELLDVSHNRLTAAGVEALRGAGPQVRVEPQQEQPYADDYFWNVGDNE